MKIEEHTGLWSSIQQFPLDDPNAAITFSHKLAAKQNWLPFFTERVIEEYRKFLFLCCISPNGASPSQVVDEAWHLHLTYTKSYWIDLCKNTLNKDIHHHPSRGGDEEDHKHHDWYAETLLLYESVFGSPPPDDIWPPPQNELPIREPAWHIRNEVLVLIVTLLSLPLIASAIQHNVLFPFALTGPQFLSFFPWLALSCIISYIILQADKCRPLQKLADEHFPTDATIYQTAQLLYGKHRAVQTAIIDLIRRNLIELTVDKRFLVHKNRYHAVDNEQNPLITGLLNEPNDSTSYEGIVNNWFNEETAKHPALQKLYLLAYRKESFIKRYNLLIIPFAVGIARFCQGLYHERPVSYLIAEMMGYSFVCYLVSEYLSRKRIVLDKVEVLTKNNKGVNTLYDDYVVSSFAQKGDSAIVWFAEGALLASIFAPYPVLNHNKVAGNDLNVSSCSSCSSGGDGGGGCGSSCGGGCGGCGGGCGS
ncbi:hypothetical protein A4H97_30975 [Niastella yeongjuensis]|uniref:TIGR04222 domain-containing membrane protein n=1 Tax=Niastella yeongjuensis TaxID=354355 RepID=A0A1V9ENR5_9BACT|nr:TIGR04222 domain-containing membrane protein [Niastella yeongjuensis]OQP47788.1 hypothetical protein A4H97_30975 [Niastella yeongjuensis]SEP45234.1 TIGR04222 domain-containing protein [Niastella yeongjuensis]